MYRHRRIAVPLVIDRSRIRVPMWSAVVVGIVLAMLLVLIAEAF